MSEHEADTRGEVTRLLSAASGGDRVASENLLPLVYDELRRLAHARMSAEAPQTLQPTALVHEAYLRLVGDPDAEWDSRAHFFGAAANAMRRILIDQARKREALKHGGGRKRVTLDDAQDADELDTASLVALDGALDELQKRDPRKAEVVMLRYFAGLSIADTASAMGLSPATVKNEWRFARAWLHHEISGAT